MNNQRFINRPYRNQRFQKQRESVETIRLKQEVEHYKRLSKGFKQELEELKVEIKDAGVHSTSESVIPSGSETGGNYSEEHTGINTE